MAAKKNALTEFEDFIMQGNVIDLAVAVIIAQVFTPIVKDAVNLILSLLAIPGTKNVDFSNLTFKVGGAVFRYGVLITDVITFIVVAAVVFFLVVRPTRALLERRRARTDPESSDRPCPQCLSEIPKAAIRCAHCTAEIGAAV
jgi:large conductance mechanosensitive channel